MKKRAQSWISSIPGFTVLAILCVVTAYYALGWLPVFFFALFLIALISYIWGRFSLLKMDMEADGIKTRAFPGENVSLSVDVSNRKIMPLLWLEVRYFEREPGFLDPCDGLTRKITWLLGRQRAYWTVEFNAIRRGVVVVEELFASSGDAFGLRQTDRTMLIDKPFMFVVYPSVYDVDILPLIQTSSHFVPSRRSCMEDNSMFAGIRGYESGDSTRFIDWRVLARQDVLTVDIHEQVAPYCICLALDFESFSRWREEVTNAGVMSVLDSFNKEGFEDMVSFSASCIRALTSKGIRCSLLLPSVLGKDNEGKVLVLSEGGAISADDIEDQEDTLLTELAGIAYEGGECLFQSLHGNGTIWFLCDKPETMSMVEEDAGYIFFNEENPVEGFVSLSAESMKRGVR